MSERFTITVAKDDEQYLVELLEGATEEQAIKTLQDHFSDFETDGFVVKLWRHELIVLH
jgi:hypothetical protein